MPKRVSSLKKMVISSKNPVNLLWFSRGGGTIYIDTTFGKLVVNSWDKEEVALSVEKTTDLASESEAKEIFDGFSVSVQKKANDILISVTDDGGSDLTEVVF